MQQVSVIKVSATLQEYSWDTLHYFGIWLHLEANICQSGQ
jgi:hypothetical protein